MFSARNQLCTATRVASIKLCTWMAKTTPYSPCTVTAFWLKYQDTARMLRRVTLTNFTGGPLAVSLFTKR